MENRKNWMQLATLMLCVALLVLNVLQSRRVSRLESELNAVRQDHHRQIQSVENSMENRFSAALKELESAVEDWQLTPLGLHAETKTIRSRMEVWLKEWQADTAVTLCAADGAGTSETIALAHTGSGCFSREISLSETAKMPLSLSVEIRTGEKNKQ